MPVRELFHIMAIVDDLDAAQALVDQLFDPVMMMEKSWSDFDKRWATISLDRHPTSRSSSWSRRPPRRTPVRRS